MNDPAARQYLALVARSKLAERLLEFTECDDWQDFVLNSLDKAAISAWERVAFYRPDIAAQLYPPLWQPEFAVLQKYLVECAPLPPATDCPACSGAGWLVLATELASGRTNPSIGQGGRLNAPCNAGFWLCTWCSHTYTGAELDRLGL